MNIFLCRTALKSKLFHSDYISSETLRFYQTLDYIYKLLNRKDFCRLSCLALINHTLLCVHFNNATKALHVNIVKQNFKFISIQTKIYKGIIQNFDRGQTKRQPGKLNHKYQNINQIKQTSFNK